MVFGPRTGSSYSVYRWPFLAAIQVKVTFTGRWVLFRYPLPCPIIVEFGKTYWKEFNKGNGEREFVNAV